MSGDTRFGGPTTSSGTGANRESNGEGVTGMCVSVSVDVDREQRDDTNSVGNTGACNVHDALSGSMRAV